MTNPRTLHLTLTKRWFDMIASGEKLEEYRELKPHWGSRLVNHWCKAIKAKCNPPYKHFDIVIFKNGYAKDAPTITAECGVIRRGWGDEKWGAVVGKSYFVIPIENIISITNYNHNEKSIKKRISA